MGGTNQRRGTGTKPAEDALIIDSTSADIDTIFARVLEAVTGGGSAAAQSDAKAPGDDRR